MESPGVVASGHPAVSEAAATVLRAGGNAFDAAVAGGFAGAIAEPVFTSLGGGGFLLARTGEGKEVLFDFFVDTPGRGLPETALKPHFFPVTVRFLASDQVFNMGRGSAAVPGNLRGYLHVHERLGRLPLREVLAPAIHLAREGIRVNAHQAYGLGLLKPIMTDSEDGRALYAPHGRSLEEGSLLVNSDLAGFLESLPDGGAESFYSGDLAQRIARDMREGNGVLTDEDLARFQVIERTPLASEYRGNRLLTNPSPSFGGPLIALSLELLASESISEFSWHSAEHLVALAAVMVEVSRLRDAGCHSAADLSAETRGESEKRIRRFSRGTTHISVADGEGNVASMTTSNGEGCGYIVPGTGIMLNNMMGEDDLHPDGFHASPPGERVSSMMSPSMLIEGDRVRLALGSGGSKRIRTVILQLVSHFVDFAQPIAASVQSPRMHWDGEVLQLEPGFPAQSIETLKQHWPVNLWPEQSLYFGGAHAVVPHEEGAGDPRRGGCALTVPERG